MTDPRGSLFEAFHVGFSLVPKIQLMIPRYTMHLRIWLIVFYLWIVYNMQLNAPNGIRILRLL